MGFFGAVAGGLVGLVTGGPARAAAGAVAGYAGEEAAWGIAGSGSGSVGGTSYPAPVDYSAAIIASSDNNKTIALQQILAQKFAMQQASIDRQLQLAANLELGIEKLDTKLQVSKMDYVVQMTAEADKHQEKLAQIFATNTNRDGLPPPDAGAG